MKIYYFIFLVLFIITGCATKEKTVNGNVPKSVYTPQKTPSQYNLKFTRNKTLGENESQTSLANDVEVVIADELIIDKDAYRIALVFPSKIVGKYARDVINTTMAYMLHNNIKFQFEVYDSIRQNEFDMQKVFSAVKKRKFNNVIVLYTQEALDNLVKIEGIQELSLYLPLVNKNDSSHDFKNIVYGGIDYEEQIKKLLTLSNKKNSIFYANTKLGLKLKDYVIESKQLVKLSTKIENTTNVFKKIVTNRALRNSSLFLNTSIIKSSIILSQLRAHGTVPYKILSTQLNYTPLVVSLTQYPDRKNFVIANSISKTDYKLQESLFLLDADIEYNWVNYSTLIGMDFLYNKNESKLFPSKIKDNQVSYDVKLYKNTRHGFKKIR
ncbi:MAG: hypothetical protein HRT43_06455 [Campylobacteraceae bacterium]|nr:hypothetical protein [Campylobacteraceae bacterium]